jgi:hypothetical protein
MKIIPEAKREPPIIRVRLLKRRRREVKECSKLGGHWKVKEKPFSPLPFPPTNLLTPSIFSL